MEVEDQKIAEQQAKKTTPSAQNNLAANQAPINNLPNQKNNRNKASNGEEKNSDGKIINSIHSNKDVVTTINKDASSNSATEQPNTQANFQEKKESNFFSFFSPIKQYINLPIIGGLIAAVILLLLLFKRKRKNEVETMVEPNIVDDYSDDPSLLSDSKSEIQSNETASVSPTHSEDSLTQKVKEHISPITPIKKVESKETIEKTDGPIVKTQDTTLDKNNDSSDEVRSLKMENSSTSTIKETITESEDSLTQKIKEHLSPITPIKKVESKETIEKTDGPIVKKQDTTSDKKNDSSDETRSLKMEDSSTSAIKETITESEDSLTQKIKEHISPITPIKKVESKETIERIDGTIAKQDTTSDKNNDSSDATLSLKKEGTSTIKESISQNTTAETNPTKTIVYKENDLDIEKKENPNSRKSIYLEQDKNTEDVALRILSDKDLEIMALNEIVIGYRNIPEQEIASAQTKLDLASSYNTQEELEKAKSLYEEVIEEGSSDQAQEAIELLKAIILKQP